MNYKKLFSSHQNKPSKSSTHHQLQTQPITYSIAHAIAGRIRLRVPRLAKDKEYTNKLKVAIESQIKNAKVRINTSASSIVINYPSGLMPDEQMRSQLVHLIQTAPNIVLPTKVSNKTIVTTIFDACANLIESLRNPNKARNAIQHRELRKDRWERLLSTGERIIQGLKSAVVFILPGKQWRSQSVLNSA
ncbi:HMA2 domain-containing protein [Nostoc piscinale]|uniref:HMA2 domain-containing protein n=1 Tax=Nostoc piscinale TaxID=224012 RepID=UPI0039A40919